MSDIILSVKNLTVSLKSNKSIILKNVSFDLKAGEVLRIGGPNGSGKTTLLKIIMLQTADYIVQSGEVYLYPFSNKNILTFNEKEILKYRAVVGFVGQKDNYDGLNKVTIGDLIDDAISVSKLSKEYVVSLFIKYFADNKRITLKSIPSKLSGGEQRMVSIFLGLVCEGNSKLFIIDEPLNNLDFQNIMRVSDLLNDVHRDNSETGMIIVTHCKIITCINRQRELKDGVLEEQDSQYECHYCMGEPDCDSYYLKKK